MLDTAVREARTRFDVRLGRADAVEATLSYGLIGQTLGDDAALLGGEGDLPAAPRHYATLRRMRLLAADRPLLLAFEDQHWSDPDSLTLVHLLCRRAPELPVAVVATARPWPDTALRRAARGARAGGHPAAGPADRSRGPGRAARPVRRARPRGGGPGRWPPATAARRCWSWPDRACTPDAAPDPGGEAPARRLLLARFAAADQTAENYLRAASALGVRFRPAIAAVIAELPAGQAAGVVEDLVRADLP